MKPETPFQILADMVMIVHFAFVLFVVLGLPAIFIGRIQGWAWVRNPWFRIIHLLAIGGVAAKAWLGRICPLTEFEMTLRIKGGGAPCSGTFIGRIVESLLYYEAPDWVFIAVYTAFGSLVLMSWIWVRPRPMRLPRIGNR